MDLNLHLDLDLNLNLDLDLDSDLDSDIDLNSDLDLDLDRDLLLHLDLDLDLLDLNLALALVLIWVWIWISMRIWIWILISIWINFLSEEENKKRNTRDRVRELYESSPAETRLTVYRRSPVALSPGSLLQLRSTTGAVVNYSLRGPAPMGTFFDFKVSFVRKFNYQKI